jgi:hypothetical protein
MIKYMDWVLENIDGEIPQPENKNIGFITTTPKVIPKKCPNDASDDTFPYCCHNGAKNVYCCTGVYMNPTCSEPTTTTQAPKCPNGAPIDTYPHCCHNGAKNKFCCTGPYINPTCSAPTIKVNIPPRCFNGPSVYPSVYPSCCNNGAPISTYPHCCKNGAKNEYCCIGPYINPTCSAPTTTRRTTTTTSRPTTWNQIISEAEPESEAVIAAKRVFKYFNELSDSVKKCNPQSVYKSFYSSYPKYIYFFRKVTSFSNLHINNCNVNHNGLAVYSDNGIISQHNLENSFEAYQLAFAQHGKTIEQINFKGSLDNHQHSFGNFSKFEQMNSEGSYNNVQINHNSDESAVQNNHEDSAGNIQYNWHVKGTQNVYGGYSFNLQFNVNPTECHGSEKDLFWTLRGNIVVLNCSLKKYFFFDDGDVIYEIYDEQETCDAHLKINIQQGKVYITFCLLNYRKIDEEIEDLRQNSIYFSLINQKFPGK